MGRRNKRPRIPFMVQRTPPKPPKEPETEKEIRTKIAELEYARIKLPKPSKRANSRIMLRWESLTNEINRLYGKLEKLDEKK